MYQAEQKDKEVIDKEFEKLDAQDLLEWTATATPFSFPCFVVWKITPEGEHKGRVVVDIRAWNKITMPDAYLVPSQTEIALTRDSKFISTVDAPSFFYLSNILEEEAGSQLDFDQISQTSNHVPIIIVVPYRLVLRSPHSHHANRI